jgi:hypothetical protein
MKRPPSVRALASISGSEAACVGPGLVVALVWELAAGRRTIRSPVRDYVFSPLPGTAEHRPTICGEAFMKSRKMRNWMMLAMESNRVIGLRLAKLMRGGKGAHREAGRMVSEKIQAAAKAGASLMAGATSDEIVRQYRKRVAANAKRLARQQRRRRKRKS